MGSVVSRRVRTIRCVVVGAALMVGQPAWSQEARSWEELVRRGTLRNGDGIYVTDLRGERIQGDVRDISTTELVVRNEDGTWMWRVDEISEIKRQDSLDNGIAIGMGVGAAIAYAACKLQDNAEQCIYGVWYYGMPAFAAATFVGAGIDSSIHKTVYQRSGFARLRVGPLLSNDSLGGSLSIEW